MHISTIEPLESRIAPAAIMVTNLGDSGEGTLRAAITKANLDAAADSIMIAKSGTITLQSALPAIIHDVTIKSRFGAAKTIISGDGGTQDFRIFDIEGVAPTVGGDIVGANVALIGLTIADGHATANTGNNTFGGGGILVRSRDGHISIAKSVIRDNTASGNSYDPNAYGGGISIYEGSVIIQSTKISGNTSMGLKGPDAPAVQFSPGLDTPGYAGYGGYSGGNAYGGGIYVGTLNGHASNLTLSLSTVSGNMAIGGAGGKGSAGTAGGFTAFYRGEPGGQGGYGGDGGAAHGGGIAVGNPRYGYLSNPGSGFLNISRSIVSGNTLKGGTGGAGGAGGAGTDGIGSYYNYTAVGGQGGSGGRGGFTTGGGVFNGFYGVATIQKSSKIMMNSASSVGTGGAGGPAGVNGATAAYNPLPSYAGLPGNSFGGGLDLFGISRVKNSLISKNSADNGGGVFSYSTKIGGNGAVVGGKYRVQLDTVTISGNTARLGGGFGGSALISHSLITGNTATKDGGGLLVRQGRLSITNSKITGNHADGDGGGVFASYVPYLQGTPGLKVTRSIVSGNTATNGGGLAGFGISSYYSSVTGNKASHDGGGVYLSQRTYGSPYIGYSTVRGSGYLFATSLKNNTAVHEGGGLASQGGNATIVFSTVSGNKAGTGGGISLHGSPALYDPYTLYYTRLSYGSLGVFASVISKNMATGAAPNTTGNGGGIFSSGGFVSLDRSTVDSNRGHDGGGLFITGNDLFANDSTFSRNTATGAGGGVVIDNDTPFPTGTGIFNFGSVIHNSTVALNKSMGSGGGIDLTNTSSLDLTNSTVALNRSSAAGGGIAIDVRSSVNLISAIVAKNTASSGADLHADSSGLVHGSVSASHSLIFSTAGFTFDSEDAITAHLAGVNPLLTGFGNGARFSIASIASQLSKGGGKGTAKQSGVAAAVSQLSGFTQSVGISIRSQAVDEGELVFVTTNSSPAEQAFANIFGNVDLTDQRGNDRLIGFTVDIGAVEVA